MLHHSLLQLQSGPLRRYNSADGPLNPPPLFYSCMSSPPCLTCVVGHAYPRPHEKSPLVSHLKSLSLDHDAGSLHNSSGSDSASDHSPPDTPGLTTTLERGKYTFLHNCVSINSKFVVLILLILKPAIQYLRTTFTIAKI